MLPSLLIIILIIRIFMSQVLPPKEKAEVIRKDMARKGFPITFGDFKVAPYLKSLKGFTSWQQLDLAFNLILRFYLENSQEEQRSEMASFSLDALGDVLTEFRKATEIIEGTNGII